MCTEDCAPAAKRSKVVGTTTTASEATTVADPQLFADDKPIPEHSSILPPADTAESSDGPPTAEVSADKGNDINATELEKDQLCKDVREKVKRKILVDMPEDFYQFWDFCKSLDPAHPEG